MKLKHFATAQAFEQPRALPVDRLVHLDVLPVILAELEQFIERGTRLVGVGLVAGRKVGILEGAGHFTSLSFLAVSCFLCTGPAFSGVTLAQHANPAFYRHQET